MKDQKFVIHLSGGSCTGKSSVADILSDRIPDIFHLSYDNVKWNFSNYHRDTHKEKVKKIVKEFFEIICKTDSSILLLTIIEDEQEYNHLTEIAEQYAYNFLNIKLKAPKEILLQRFRERVRSAKKAGSKISITDEKLFLNNSSKDFFTPNNAKIFDSSKLSPEEIADEILKLLN